MKRNLSIFIALFISAGIFAQSPEKISYQAVIRNAVNTLITNQPVGMQISILQGSASGTAVYIETQTATTNANGLIGIEIGTGTVVQGNLSTIDWAAGPYFIKTEADPTGGTNYTISGTSQLLSVPYALYAKTAETITGTINETDPVFTSSVAKNITAADTIYWNHKLDSEVDGSLTNELQALSLSNDTIYLTNGGSVKISNTAWSLNGNANTTALNFIGTTDNVPLKFKVNGQTAGTIDPNGRVTLGAYAGNNSTNQYAVAVGYQALSSGNIGDWNSGIGYQALSKNTSGSFNTAVGSQSMKINTTGEWSSAFGANTLFHNTTGTHNTAIGALALSENTIGGNNTAVGYGSLLSNVSGLQNSALGLHSLKNLRSGNFNTSIGFESGYSNVDGSNNVFIGNYSGYNETGSNKLYISNSQTSTPLIYGDFSTATLTIYNNLNVNNKYTFPSVDGTSGQILTTNGSGTISWATNEFQVLRLSNDTIYLTNGGFVKLPATLYWNSTGNPGTNPDANFIGTTDNVPLTFKVNNEKAGSIENGSGNTFLGYQSGNNNVSGSYNTGFGTHTLNSNNFGGDGNTAIGYNSLLNNTNGYNNLAVGINTLEYNTTGKSNVAMGGSAMNSNISGVQNTATGAAAINRNTVGNGNTANGYYALFSNKAGSNATAIGYNAMLYSNNSAVEFENTNVAVGFEALRGSTNAADNTGNSNTAIGYQAMLNNSSGSWNAALGDEALNANTTGYGNTAIGRYALKANTTGYNNTLVGQSSMFKATNVNNNASLGCGSMLNQTSGDNNTSIGTSSLYNNISGNNNTVLGFETGFYSTGASNVFLGYRAGYNETGSNKLYISNSETSTPLIYGDFSAAKLTIYSNLNINNKYTFPSVDGKIGQILRTNGSGVISWDSLSTIAATGSYNDLKNRPLLSDTISKYVDGSETRLSAGTNVIITGSGTAANPYIVNSASTHYVGELYGGGVVFWVDHTGQHGLVVSMIDLSTSQIWSNVSSLIGTTNDWDGAGNTAAITGQSGHTSSAAQLCSNYTNDDYGTGTYSDWYLPSLGELNHAWNNLYEVQKALSSDGDATTTTFKTTSYWSSTEYVYNAAYAFSFFYGYPGDPNGNGKSLTRYVRAVRAF